jgi:hypothetical protein
MTIDLVGRQVCAAERLGQAVHQEQLGLRLNPPQRPNGVNRQPATGVSHRSKPWEGLSPEHLCGQQLKPQRRHSREHSYLQGSQGANDLLGYHGSLNHECGTGAHCTEELVETVIEAEREQARYAVITAYAQIARYSTRAGPEVGVTDSDTLGLPGGPRGVNDLSYITAHPTDRHQTISDWDLVDHNYLCVSLEGAVLAGQEVG